MKLASVILLGAAFAFSAACHATPEPPSESAPVEETAIEPEPAPIIMPKVGGPCTYQTSDIVGTVTAVFEGTVELTEPEGRKFNLPLTVFPEPPAIGETVNVLKRTITKGTCSPFIYSYAAPPATPEPVAEPAN